MVAKIEKKGMPFDNDFGYCFPLFPFLPNKREEEMENELAKNRNQSASLSARLVAKFDL